MFYYNSCLFIRNFNQEYQRNTVEELKIKMNIS